MLPPWSSANGGGATGYLPDHTLENALGIQLGADYVEGFFASDFTLAEIKQLRAVQPLAERDASFNGQFQIPRSKRSSTSSSASRPKKAA